MRQVEWHELREGEIPVIVIDGGDIIAGVGQGGKISSKYTITHVARADQASNENGVISITVGMLYQFPIDQAYVNKYKDRQLQFYSCEQDEVGQDALVMLSTFMGQVGAPQPNDKPFISTTTTTMENGKNGGTSVIGEISCSPGVTFAIGNELNDRIIQRIELSEDHTIIELFDPDGDRIVTIRPLEYTAFYIKPNQEGQA